MTKINWETIVQAGFLEEKGWVRVYVDDDPEYLYPPGRPLGWIKEPSVRMYSTEEAFEKEIACQAQE